MIVAVSARSESGDDYLFCLSGSDDEVISKLEQASDFAYWYTWEVVPLARSEYKAAEILSEKIREAIAKASDDE